MNAREREPGNSAEWREVPGYNGEYFLSSRGQLERVTGGNRYILSNLVASNGKYYVTLWKNGQRKNVMLHNLYSRVFGVSVCEAQKIIYKGYTGSAQAKENVRNMLTMMLHVLEESRDRNNSMENCHDEILYIEDFISQLELK